MKRQEAIQHALKRDKTNFCKGCNAFHAGINRGIAIADNSPLHSSVGNIIIQELTDAELERFKKDCKTAYEGCLEEIEKRKLY